MEIALIAHDTKNELITQFCIAYSAILSKHHLCASSVTGKFIEDATNLNVAKLFSYGTGVEQILSRVACNEIDLVIFFRDTVHEEAFTTAENELFRNCDTQNIPIATNLATAEILIRALEAGDLDWREILNPLSDYNRRRRGLPSANTESKPARAGRRSKRQ